MAPPRHRRKSRPSRVVTAAPPAEPEPAPPPVRRGLLQALVGPTPALRPRPVVPAGTGPAWTRKDWYVLAGLVALVVVVLGLLIGIADNPSATVVSSPAPTTTSFTVTSGGGKSFYCNQSISVGGTQDTVAKVDGDQVTLVNPLSSPPVSGASVSQSNTFPSTVFACGAVAASPKPTTTQLSLAGGAGEDFENAAVQIGNTAATIKSVDQTSFRLTLSSALPEPPAAGAEVTQQLFTVGSLIGGVVGLTISEIAIFILAVAALLMRPFASRITKKARPRMLETLVFGALVALVDTVIYFLEASTLASTSGAQVVFEWILAAAAGFILVPPLYPSLRRLFRPRPRPAR